MVSLHLTDVVAAGGSDGLVDHLLTHDVVECLLDTTQQTSLREGTKKPKHCVHAVYSTLQYMQCSTIPLPSSIKINSTTNLFIAL